MAMQTIPSRLTIWTSFKGLPTASPFFRAKRNDAARRSDGTGKFQSPWGGTLGQPHGLFNFPALIRTPLADLLAQARTFSRHLYSPDGLSLIYWRVSCAAAAARCAASLVPFTAPLHLRPMSVAADAGVLSPSAPARGILALLSASLFRIRPVMVIFPLRKQIIRRRCNFLRLRTLFCPCKVQTGCRSADLLRFCA